MADAAGANIKDLNDHIEFLGNSGEIRDVGVVHATRKKRNILAHERQQYSTWDDVSLDISILRQVLQKMGLIGEIPKYQIFGESGQLEEDKSDPKALGKRTVSVYVKANGKKGSEISFIQKLMRNNS